MKIQLHDSAWRPGIQLGIVTDLNLIIHKHIVYVCPPDFGRRLTKGNGEWTKNSKFNCNKNGSKPYEIGENRNRRFYGCKKNRSKERKQMGLASTLYIH